MAKILSEDIVKNISEVQKGLDIIRGKYLTDYEDDNFKLIIDKLYPENPEKAKLMNPGSHIGSIAYDNLSDTIGNPKTKYKIDWMTVYEGLLTTGYLRFFIDVENNALKEIKANSYYYDGLGTEYFITLLEGEQENGNFFFNQKQKEKFMLLKTFSKNILRTKLYKINSFGLYNQGDEVSLNTLEQTKDITPEISIKRDRLVTERKVEHPVIEKIISTIYAIDRNLASNEHLIGDFGQQWTILKNLKIPEEYKIELASGGSKIVDINKLKFLETEELDGVSGGIEVIKNSYEGIEIALKIIDGHIRRLSAVTKIPLFAFGIESKEGNDSGTSKSKSAGPYYKKIEKYQDIIREIFESFWDEIGLVESKRILVFTEIESADPKDILEQEEKKLEKGITSKIRAIMKVEGVTREEAKNILEEIQEENLLLNSSNEIKNSGANDFKNKGIKKDGTE